MGDALGYLYNFLYQLPYLAGLGDHWPISPGEAKTLGRATEACLKAVPQKSRAKVVKQITLWLPWVSLTSTAFIITYPRILQTSMVLSARRVNSAGATHSEGLSPSGDRFNPSPDGYADGIPTWAGYKPNAGGRH